METKDAILGRRSIRKYTDKAVSDEALEQVLEAALMAPSGINLQPWFFTVVRSPEKRRELFEITGQVFGKFRPVLEKRFQRNPEAVEETKEFLNSMGGAPVVILVFMLKPDYEDETTVISGISAAIENLCLRAYDLGMGTCWMTAALRAGSGEELHQHFAPDKGRFLGMVTLGYPDISPNPPTRRPGRVVYI
ncbi:MAG: nitroreductase family protein [Oscillospiraceae bacterium]